MPSFKTLSHFYAEVEDELLDLIHMEDSIDEDSHVERLLQEARRFLEISEMYAQKAFMLMS